MPPKHKCTKPKYCIICYNFYYNQSHKAEIKKRKQLDRKKNPVKYKQQWKRWYNKNKTAVLEKRKKVWKKKGKQLYKHWASYYAEYRKTHKTEARIYNQKYRKAHKKELQIKQRMYGIKNRKKINRRLVLKRKNDPIFNLICRLRSNLRNRVKNDTIGKIRYLPFTMKQLYKSLEQKFKPGMSWKNMKKWHIDHIIPLKYRLSNGTYYWNQEDLLNPKSKTFKTAWGLDNLQPLWAKQNLKKGNKLEISLTMSAKK